MPDTTYQPKIYRKNGGDEMVVASGGTLTAETGSTLNLSGAAVTLPTNLQTGYINFPLTAMRVVASNDVPAKGAADGGVISKDTDPILERVNAATDKRLRLKWAAASVVEIIAGSFAYPPDLDDTAAITIKILAKMAGATDVPVLAVSFFEGTGDTNAGGNTAALSATEAVVSVTIAAGDVGAAPKSATLGITPAAHGTDALDIYAVWAEYTRKTS